MKIEDLTIVVCCNKKDFFFAKLCVASIRYYYPKIKIELVKDIGNGDFDTKEISNFFQVEIVNFGLPRLGWSGAKFHYLYRMPKGKKVLIIDADIIFLGPFIEKNLQLIEKSDFVVSPEYGNNQYEKWVKEIYFDTAEIERVYPNYNYPGYFFNAGQIFITGGSIEEKEIDKYFDQFNFPFWRNQKLFPAVDQSVYNYLLPTLHKSNKIKLEKFSFMLWSKSEEVSKITISEIKNKTCEKGLIHWAGDIRTPYINYMTRHDILNFFEDQYYSHVPNGWIKNKLGKIIPAFECYMQTIYKWLKNTLQKK